MKKIIQEYKTFALKGNVFDMAIGIVIGGAFATITSSLVANIIAPLIGLLTSGVDMSNLFTVLKPGLEGGQYLTIAEAKKDAAVVLNYGLFLNSVISFLIISWAVFFVVKGINRLREKEEKNTQKPPVTTKPCPFCYTTIHVAATRCPQCTSTLDTPPQ